MVSSQDKKPEEYIRVQFGRCNNGMQDFSTAVLYHNLQHNILVAHIIPLRLRIYFVSAHPSM